MTDRLTDAGRTENKDAYARPYHEGSHVASLVKFHPVVYEEIA